MSGEATVNTTIAVVMYISIGSSLLSCMFILPEPWAQQTYETARLGIKRNLLEGQECLDYIPCYKNLN